MDTCYAQSFYWLPTLEIINYYLIIYALCSMVKFVLPLIMELHLK
jgi:hypothetical protein